MFSDEDDPVLLNDLKLNCLLYAEDLLLLSRSQKGLQSCLDKLSDYCEQNCLIVNISKTNVLVFCKGKCPVINIYYRSQLITQVNTYKFLGIVFSANGLFHHCQEDLCKRALRAYFKLLKCISSSNINVKSFVHLFDHTIKPV